MRAIAVISGPAFSKLETYADAGTRYSGPKAGTDRYQYVLQRGWKVGPEAHGDNHCLNYGTSTRNRTVVLATSLGKASVMDAMLNRRFYTSSDMNAQMFFGTADLTKVMGQTFTTASATLDLLAWISDPDGSAVSDGDALHGQPRRRHRLPDLRGDDERRGRLLHRHGHRPRVRLGLLLRLRDARQRRRALLRARSG